MSVTAVMTWFRPGPEALDSLADALRECDAVVVVDNTPPGEPTLEVLQGVDHVRMGRNAGLAVALNTGLLRVPAGTTAVLLLDQDSRLPDGLVGGLQRLLTPGVGAVAPAPWDEQARRYLDPRTARRPVVADLPVTITSGLLVQREAWERIGPLREDFFVDAVDLDLCLRLRDAGYRILQDRSWHLAHRLGETRWHRVLGIGIRASHHPDWRLYSGARNSARLTRERWRTDTRWAMTNAALLGYWLATVVAFEPPRPARARLFLSGLADGWRGRPARIAVPPQGSSPH